MALRAVLIWLLVLAVPAQGVAGASMTFCGPNHHGGVALAAERVVSAHPHAHHGEAAPAQEPEPAPALDAPVDDDGSAAAKAGQASQQKCSACASCCSAGAMLGTVPGVPRTDPAPTVFTTVVPTVDLFAADGPERPPRHILA